MNRTRLVILFSVLLSISAFAFYKNKMAKTSENNITKLKSDDQIFLNYKDTAQSQLPYLIKFMSEHERNEKLFRYAVKANFIENDKSEHMWVQVSDFKDDCFLVRLANEPGTIKLIKYGDDVKVKRSDVEDWILEDFLLHTKVGGFSQKYLEQKGK